MINIQDKDGNIRISVEITDKCVYSKKLMEEEYVLLSFESDTLIAFANGDFIQTEFGIFRIVNLDRPRQSEDGGYVYEQKFHADWERWRNHIAFYDRQHGSEKSWKMTQTPEYFLDIICSNIDKAGLGLYTFDFDSSLTEMKLVEFDGTNIIDALTKVAEAWETEWWISDNIIHLSKCEFGSPVVLAENDELGIIECEEGRDTNYFTRAYVFGSTRNLPKNYRKSEDNGTVIESIVEKRLKLPVGTPYIDAWDGMKAEDVVEGVIILDEVYPRRVGTISTVTTKKYTDEIENEDGSTTKVDWNAFRFKDNELAALKFNSDYILPGEELRITFQTGKLAGMDFAVAFNPDGVNESSVDAQLFEIIRNEDYGVALPTDDFKPEESDTYILYGYDTKFVYDKLVGETENELLVKGKEKLAEISSDKSVYTCPTNPICCAGYAERAGELFHNPLSEIDLDVGQCVKLISDNYFGGSDGYRISRVRAFEKRLDNKFDCTYEVGETASYSKSAELDEKVEALTVQTTQILTGGNGVYLIKRHDSSVPSDHNAYSSLRARIEFMCRSVAEYVRTRWTFLKGINIGTFSAGKSGAQIDASGNAEVGSITARGDAAVGGDATVGGKVDANDVAATNSIVTPRITTPNYRSDGLTGEGAGIYTDDAGLTHGEFDFIIARRGLTLTELTIEEIRSVGAGFVASKGACEVEKVYEHPGQGYSIYLKDVNKFVAGDFVRYARYDYTNGTYRWAWVKVQTSNPRTRNITLSVLSFTDGMSAPEPGDILVQMGHATDTTRQGFVYITDKGVQCFDGVNSTSLVGKCRGVFGDLTGITDNGKALSGYGVWTDTLYIGTGKTVYATFAELYASVAATDSALAAYRTEVGSRFDVVNGSLTSIQKSVTSLQTGGGRNLLLKTNRGATGWHATTNATYQPIIAADKSDSPGSVLFNYPNGNISPTWESYDYALRPELIVEGRTYTLSGEIKGGNADNMKLSMYIATTSGSSILTSAATMRQPLVSGEWVKFSGTLTAIKSGTKNGGEMVRFAPQQADKGRLTYISFRNLKLEEGEEATAYSAAPEDYVDGEITAVKSTITEVEQTVDSISARVEEVNTSLDGKISANTTKINQTASAITSEASARTEGDAALSTKITQTASGISLKLSQMALSNINHAIGTETPFVVTSDFGNKENKVKILYNVTGIATGDIVTFSLIIRFKGLTWGSGAFISFQLSGEYGYRGWPIRITEQYLVANGITPDADGYYKVRCQGTSTAIATEVSPDDVGDIQMRMDYIDAGETGAVIEISQLKLELGNTATAWTSRTGDLDEALADTGIDISHRLINATADNFKIRNNRGVVTMEVDEYGNLTSNAVLVRNLDASTAQYTPYLTTINLSNGYIQLYYPLDYDNGNDNLSLQIGWDEESGSVFRFFGKDGTMAWKAGSQASLIDTSLSTETTITPVNMYKCKATTLAKASAEIKTTSSLPATRLYKKVVQTMGTTTTAYYSDAQCQQAADGYYAEAGLPGLMMSEEIRPITPSSSSPEIPVSPGKTTYNRCLYKITAGSRGIGQIVTWSEEDLLVEII